MPKKNKQAMRRERENRDRGESRRVIVVGAVDVVVVLAPVQQLVLPNEHQEVVTDGQSEAGHEAEGPREGGA